MYGCEFDYRGQAGGNERRRTVSGRTAPSRRFLLPPIRHGDRSIRGHASAGQYPVRPAPLHKPPDPRSVLECGSVWERHQQERPHCSWDFFWLQQQRGQGTMIKLCIIGREGHTRHHLEWYLLDLQVVKRDF